MASTQAPAQPLISMHANLSDSVCTLLSLAILADDLGAQLQGQAEVEACANQWPPAAALPEFKSVVQGYMTAVTELSERHGQIAVFSCIKAPGKIMRCVYGSIAVLQCDDAYICTHI